MEGEQTLRRDHGPADLTSLRSFCKNRFISVPGHTSAMGCDDICCQLWFNLQTLDNGSSGFRQAQEVVIYLNFGLRSL